MLLYSASIPHGLTAPSYAWCYNTTQEHNFSLEKLSTSTAKASPANSLKITMKDFAIRDHLNHHSIIQPEIAETFTNKTQSQNSISASCTHWLQNFRKLWKFRISPCFDPILIGMRNLCPITAHRSFSLTTVCTKVFSVSIKSRL